MPEKKRRKKKQVEKKSWGEEIKLKVIVLGATKKTVHTKKQKDPFAFPLYNALRM
jgi:hypothetical protein